jgi:GT2 family glycosyltransferase
MPHCHRACGRRRTVGALGSRPLTGEKARNQALAECAVMFRRDAYERAGGYREAFYYGQDFDLWYRMAAVGKFQTVPDVLYTARVTPDSLSGVARSRQQRLGELSRAALEARQRGESDAAIVAAAAKITRTPHRGASRRAEGLYFIGEALRRNGDRRARRYLRQSIAARPLFARAWFRYVQSLVL